MSETIRAWHWLGEDKKLANDDKRKPRAGHWLVHKGEISLCHSGLHASEKLFDSLQYAPGPIICRVEVAGKIVRGNDKLVAEKRKILWMADASRVLREFACLCAERALDMMESRGEKADPRSRAAIDASRRFARGEATRDELDAAWAAAMDAARTAAWDAARAAAWAAARDAEQKWQAEHLEQLIWGLAPPELREDRPLAPADAVAKKVRRMRKKVSA